MFFPTLSPKSNRTHSDVGLLCPLPRLRIGGVTMMLLLMTTMMVQFLITRSGSGSRSGC
ncbi:uncharacterized protein EI97DRAFT_184042 [Westerdykella ornata]|uniref:Uncharacterized protein n=1 Tax=Westerdykella ornata TaxID=318751 RepID=A0A6A6JSV7_WESOR|nr:uncharacterized protein EI97DRAFT_184042 [Westerdykella ornata]KAF2279690.1 hypothetical protein EI97DRAFT_184042 [Westerdykella ornata]